MEKVGSIIISLSWDQDSNATLDETTLSFILFHTYLIIFVSANSYLNIMYVINNYIEYF